jgi:hypothetical protein
MSTRRFKQGAAHDVSIQPTSGEEEGARSSRDDLDLGLEAFDFLGGWQGSVPHGVERPRGWGASKALRVVIQRLVRRT